MQVVLRAAADAALEEVDRHKYYMSGIVSLEKNDANSFQAISKIIFKITFT